MSNLEVFNPNRRPLSFFLEFVALGKPLGPIE